MNIRNSGFTLVELLIVVAIVAILANFAIPAYQDQMRKGRRSDGISAALQVAQSQERFFTMNHTYANSVTVLGFSADPYVSEEGYYNVAINIPGSCTTTVGGVSTHSCFNVTATAVAAQASDDNCATLTINDRGQKTSANGSSTDTTGDCW